MDMKKLWTAEDEIRHGSYRKSGLLKKDMPEYAVARLKEAYEDDDARGAGYRGIDNKSVNSIPSAG